MTLLKVKCSEENHAKGGEDEVIGNSSAAR